MTKWHQRLNWMGLAWLHQWLHQHRWMYLYFCQLYVVKSQIMSNKSEGPTDRREGGVATKPPLRSNGSVLQPNLGSCNEGESSLYRQKNGDKKTEAPGAVVERPQESFSRGGWQQQDTSTGRHRKGATEAETVTSDTRVPTDRGASVGVLTAVEEKRDDSRANLSESQSSRTSLLGAGNGVHSHLAEIAKL